MKQTDAAAVFIRTISDISLMEDKGQVLNTILEAVLQISRASRGFIMTKIADHEQQLKIVCGSNVEDDGFCKVVKLIGALSFKNQQIVYHEDAVDDESLAEYRDYMLDIDFLMCMPVLYRREMHAALYLDSSTVPFSISDENIPVINALVVHALAENILYPEDGYGMRTSIDVSHFEKLCKSFSITGKESEVLLLMIKQLTKKQIAEERSISVNTVKHHISNIYKKTGACSREELIEIFFSQNDSENFQKDILR